MTDVWHVEPVNDLKPHSGEFCKCGPRVEVQSNGSKLVVHNSWDGREFWEVENQKEIHKLMKRLEV